MSAIEFQRARRHGPAVRQLWSLAMLVAATSFVFAVLLQ